MSDLYQKVVNTPVGKSLVNALNLPAPVMLERYQDESSLFVQGDVLLGLSQDARLGASIAEVLNRNGAKLSLVKSQSLPGEAGRSARTLDLSDIEGGQHFKALVFDATGLSNSTQLRQLYDFFHPSIQHLARCGRVLIVGLAPEQCEPEQAAAQRALLGFAKSVGKEVGKKGATSNVIYVSPDSTKTAVRSSIEFLTSPRSAYISGQCIRTGSVPDHPVGVKGAEEAKFLSGKTALVTGASRGIGEAIAHVLARYGARVVCLDVPQSRELLEKVADSVEGQAMLQDITQPEAPANIAALARELGGLDILVHNAGITRDKTLGRMKPHFWDLLMEINLTAMERINAHLLEHQAINARGRIVCVASISGIAGNFGQTNYAASKAGVIGYVESMSHRLPEEITINAVAPGFIETQMTAAIPFAIREAGRRMNSLSQGGQPDDVAELIAHFAHPESQAVNGNVVRVCGLSLIGS